MLAAAAVSLQGTNYGSLAGLYSVFLQGTYRDPSPKSAAIGQTGQVPITAQTLIFWANTFLSAITNDMEVTFNNQAIPYFATSSGAGYTVYAADISAFAGSTGQLLFTAMPNTWAMIDNIQFSSSGIPEPATVGLLGLGLLCFALRLHPKAFAFCSWNAGD